MNFISPLYLWLLPLVLTPLLIYLFNKNKNQTIRFSSLFLLEEIKEESIKKINLLNILLLIIRTLIILFFIIMMSRPTYNVLASNNDTDNIIVIAIDNSLSMANSLNGQIQKTIKSITQNFNENTYVKILLLENGETVFEGYNVHSNSHDYYFDIAYKNCELSNIYKIIDQSDQFLNKYLFLVSDGQKNTLETEINIPAGDKWIINYIKLKKDLDDASVISAISSHDYIDVKEPFVITVKVKNNGNYILKNHLIEIYIENNNVGKKYIDLQIGEVVDVSFNIALTDYGQHQCYIKTQDDDILENNKLYFIIDILETINVDVIDNYPKNFFLDKLLDSYNSFQDTVRVDVSYYTKESFIDNQIQNNVLIINGLDNISKELKNKLNQINKNIQFNIIVFPDLNNNNFDKVNNLIDDKINSTYRDSLSNEQYVEINYSNIKDEKFKDIFLNNSSNRNIKVFNYISHDMSDRTVIPLSNNRMLLDKYKINNLNIYLFSISLNLQSTNFPIKGSIIPVLKNLIMTDKMFAYYDADTPISSMNILNASKITNQSGDNSYIYNENSDNNETIQTLGFHNVNNGNNRNKKIAINVSENEKASVFLQNNEILSLLPINSSISNNVKDIEDFISKTIVGYDLWRIFLYAILFLLLFEMWLINIYFKND